MLLSLIYMFCSLNFFFELRISLFNLAEGIVTLCPMPSILLFIVLCHSTPILQRRHILRQFSDFSVVILFPALNSSKLVLCTVNHWFFFLPWLSSSLCCMHWLCSFCCWFSNVYEDLLASLFGWQFQGEEQRSSSDDQCFFFLQLSALLCLILQLT